MGRGLCFAGSRRTTLIAVMIRSRDLGPRSQMQQRSVTSLLIWISQAQRKHLDVYSKVDLTGSLVSSFTHYLRSEDGGLAKSLWSMVAANNDPTNAPYTFSVRCAKDDDTGCKAPKGGRGQRSVIRMNRHRTVTMEGHLFTRTSAADLVHLALQSPTRSRRTEKMCGK